MQNGNSRIPNVKTFFPEYNDDFSQNPVWNSEIDEWLKFVYGLNPEYCQRWQNDIANPKKRAEFLGEIKVMYYYHKFLKAINLEVKYGSGGIDFQCEIDNKHLLIEVKSPSWLAEIFNDPDLSKEQQLQRKNEPQYIDGETYGVSPDAAIKDSIRKALDELSNNREIILVIVPNMRLLLHHSRLFEVSGQRIISDELIRQDPDKRISKVAILETVLLANNNKIDYLYGEYYRK